MTNRTNRTTMTLETNMFALILAPLLAACAAADGPGAADPAAGAQGAASATQPEAPEWLAAETLLSNHVQLTFPDRFHRAGEAYFSPDDRRIIFQAVETPEPGKEASHFYAMYVADVVRDGEGRVSGLESIERLSPPGSSNTCGWFHPTRPGHVIFGSTLVRPSNAEQAGYQRGSRNYVWRFPREMTIVECDLSLADGTAKTLDALVEDPNAYLAECSISRDGRHLVYCRHVTEEGKSGGDLFVLDLETRKTVAIADERGYDGGPFFSPDGRRLCYRSDRRGDDLLQIFVAELAFGPDGAITGVEREFQLTNDEYVNWAPFWHPSGAHLVYTTSEQGHKNYELYLFDADAGRPGPARYGSGKHRVTHAPGFDGLAAFDSAGTTMVWTSQRDASGQSELWAATFRLP